MKNYKFSEIINVVLNNKGCAFFYTPPIYEKAKSYLFYNPTNIIKISQNKDITELLKQIDSELKDKYCYCMLNYELGYWLENKFDFTFDESTEFGEFVFFEKTNVQEIKTKKIKHDLLFPQNKLKPVKNVRLNTRKKEYVNNINKIKNYIAEGDTYQVNYTLKAEYELNVDIVLLINFMIFMQSAKYIAIINCGDNIVISVSPELFFKIKGNKISVAPMKGTIKRGINLADDKLNKTTLLSNEKEQAENLMIVDLMRNDLGRFAETGSVEVKELFKVEKYETLYQMISIINAKIKNVKFSDVILKMFPCGSITGAPKIRTMEIIKELETENRGIYTGGIGFAMGNNVALNVAIRTLVINKEKRKGLLGLGSGIVWDGIANNEFEEVILKADFLTKPFEYYELFESVLAEGKKIFLFEEHLNRLEKSAEYFLFKYNKKEIKKRVYALIESIDYDKYKIKITLNKWGDIKLDCVKLEQNNVEIKVVISEKRTNSKNKFQYFKTTLRNIYDKELSKYKKKGFGEVLFLNENDFISEGSYTNIFVEYKEEFNTPPINAGILNGIYRKYLLKKLKNAKENDITMNDLKNADSVFVCNSVRKQINVSEVWYKGECIWKRN